MDSEDSDQTGRSAHAILLVLSRGGSNDNNAEHIEMPLNPSSFSYYDLLNINQKITVFYITETS